MSESKFQRVVIKLAGKVVVWLRNALSTEASSFAEHRGKIILFVVDLHLAEGFALVTLESVWVDNSLDFLLSFVHHVVSGGEVTLLKGVLGCAMADE